MKCLLRASVPSETGSEAIRDGSMMEKMQRILAEIKPEAVYFATEYGNRTMYLIVNVDDAKQLQTAAEPWWLLFNAEVSITPVFTMQDMESMGPTLENIVKKFG